MKGDYIPGYFKRVPLAEAYDDLQVASRCANPFHNVQYEVVVDNKGVVHGDYLDVIAQRITSMLFIDPLEWKAENIFKINLLYRAPIILIPTLLPLKCNQ